MRVFVVWCVYFQGYPRRASSPRPYLRVGRPLPPPEGVPPRALPPPPSVLLAAAVAGALRGRLEGLQEEESDGVLR